MFTSFVLEMNQFLSEGVSGFAVHWDVMLGEDSFLLQKMQIFLTFASSLFLGKYGL